MKELLKKYDEQFDDQFPIMLCGGMDEKEIIEIIQKCIDENKPYEPEINDNADY